MMDHEPISHNALRSVTHSPTRLSDCVDVTGEATAQDDYRCDPVAPLVPLKKLPRAIAKGTPSLLRTPL